jgi:ankyrin repeat protein
LVSNAALVSLTLFSFYIISVKLSLDSPFGLPYGTPLHWAAASCNFTAMKALLNSGAAIDATCFNDDPHSTPLSLAVHIGDVGVASFLLNNGADPGVRDSQGHTLLHLLSLGTKLRHVSFPFAWHYWIRHGTWEEHKYQMSEMVQLLCGAGVGLEHQSTYFHPRTPIVEAASSGRVNEGAIIAFINAGANVNGPKDSLGESVLHMWSSTTSLTLKYPGCYSEVMAAIINVTKDLESANEFKQTPLHMITIIQSSREQFSSNAAALLSKPSTIDINATDHHGATPLLIALRTGADAMYRAMILLDYGADIYTIEDSGENIITSIIRNRSFMDEESAAHIKTLLLRVNESPSLAFKNFEKSSSLGLWYACDHARPKTLELLLDLGMSKHINEVWDHHGGTTALDRALDMGEASRNRYIDNCAQYERVPGSKQVEESDHFYDVRQGDQKRARKYYHIQLF